jgi:4-carboxymuconolactone decarboxylase
LSDDVLFGQVWSREAQLSARDRSLITISALMASGILDTSLKNHLIRAKENGLTKDEIVEAITHLVFMRAGPKPGPLFVWQKKYWQINRQTESLKLFGS